jgi:hypothetical protein
LNGFQPIDMESWWAERSFLFMMNENSCNRLNNKENTSEPSNKTIINPLIYDFKKDEQILTDKNNNNCSALITVFYNLYEKTSVLNFK